VKIIQFQYVFFGIKKILWYIFLITYATFVIITTPKMTLKLDIDYAVYTQSSNSTHESLQEPIVNYWYANRQYFKIYKLIHTMSK